MAVDIDAIYAHARFDDLDIDARSQWVGKGKQLTLNALCKLATTVVRFLRDLDFQTFIWLDYLFSSFLIITGVVFLFVCIYIHVPFIRFSL